MAAIEPGLTENVMKSRQDHHYSGAPNVLTGLSSEVIRRTLYPLMLKRWHPTARRRLRELSKYEFAPLESIEAIQWAKLQAMVQQASQHVPYYRKLFREQGIRPADI